MARRKHPGGVGIGGIALQANPLSSRDLPAAYGVLAEG